VWMIFILVFYYALYCRVVHLCVRAAGAKNVEQFFSTMSRQLTEHEWTVVKSAGDEWSQLATFYRHWVRTFMTVRGWCCNCCHIKCTFTNSKAVIRGFWSRFAVLFTVCQHCLSRQVWCSCSVKTVWSMPENFRGELLTIGCYTNPASFTFFYRLIFASCSYRRSTLAYMEQPSGDLRLIDVTGCFTSEH